MSEAWWIESEIEGQLLRTAPFDVAAWSKVAAGATWLSSDRQSAAAKVVTPAGPLLVKWRHTVPKRRRKTTWRASKERREARAYLELGALGVKAPVPWAVGERRRRGVLVGSVLVRPFHEGCRDARELSHGDGSLVETLARDLRAWHDAGFRHGDCYPKNVLVPDSGTAPFPVGCPAARFRPSGTRPDRHRRKDLAQWATGVLEIAPEADPFAFLGTYCEAPGFDRRALEDAVRPLFERVVRRKTERDRTQPQREPGGPPQPSPLDGPAGRTTMRAIATLRPQIRTR